MLGTTYLQVQGLAQLKSRFSLMQIPLLVDRHDVIITSSGQCAAGAAPTLLTDQTNRQSCLLCYTDCRPRHSGGDDAEEDQCLSLIVMNFSQVSNNEKIMK